MALFWRCIEIVFSEITEDFSVCLWKGSYETQTHTTINSAVIGTSSSPTVFLSLNSAFGYLCFSVTA